jgi:uncharacterized iron-regulated protein
MFSVLNGDDIMDNGKMNNTGCCVKRLAAAVAVLSVFAAQSAFAQKIEFAKEKKAVVKHYRFVGDHKEE